MSLQGKGKALAVFAIIMSIFIIIFFLPEDRQEEIDSQDFSEAAGYKESEEDLEYMKEFAWYAEEDGKRYWFFLTEKETADGKEECSAITYTENMDIPVDIHDLSKRFTDELYYDHVSTDGERLSMRRQDGKFIESPYNINEKQNTLSMYSVTDATEKAMVYHAADFDTLIYPTY